MYVCIVYGQTRLSPKTRNSTKNNILYRRLADLRDRFQAEHTSRTAALTRRKFVIDIYVSLFGARYGGIRVAVGIECTCSVIIAHSRARVNGYWNNEKHNLSGRVCVHGYSVRPTSVQQPSECGRSCNRS